MKYDCKYKMKKKKSHQKISSFLQTGGIYTQTGGIYTRNEKTNKLKVTIFNLSLQRFYRIRQ